MTFLTVGKDNDNIIVSMYCTVLQVICGHLFTSHVCLNVCADFVHFWYLDYYDSACYLSKRGMQEGS